MNVLLNAALAIALVGTLAIPAFAKEELKKPEKAQKVARRVFDAQVTVEVKVKNPPEPVGIGCDYTAEWSGGTGDICVGGPQG